MRNSILIIILLGILSCSSPKARKPISRTTSTFLNESIERNKKLNKIEEDFFKELMQKDSLHNYKKSNTGFWYFTKNLKDTLKIMPKKGDHVIINYEIKDVFNNIIYSKEELGSREQQIKGDRLYKIDGEEFITGLQEGIKLMHLGETTTFLFPSNKVFGVTGFQDRIAPNQPLIITVFLKEINPTKK